MLDVNFFHSMRIGLASPDKIRQRSYAEIKKPRIGANFFFNDLLL